jgi:hypothetical protein
MSVESQRLIYKGKQLKDDKRLDEYSKILLIMISYK